MKLGTFIRRLIPVSASRLHERNLIAGGVTLQRASLFPFFDVSGATELVLIVDAESADLYTFAIGTGRVWIPLWGTIRIDGAIQPLDDEVTARLAPLWHYDPWWVLRDERFAFHSSVPILKATNCADAFRIRARNVHFSRQLGHLGWVTYRTETDEDETGRFHRDMLPERRVPRMESTEADAGGWRLAPFWR